LFAGLGFSKHLCEFLNTH
jgi:G-patch domain